MVKRLIQGRNNLTWVRVEPRLCYQGRRENNAVTLSATLPTYKSAIIISAINNNYAAYLLAILLIPQV